LSPSAPASSNAVVGDRKWTCVSALAAMLHSFYGGVENIFKRVTLELGERLPAGQSWHKELLDSMTNETDKRFPLISPELKKRLKDYLEFRHFFRHSYVFDLEWERMKTVVLDLRNTLDLLESELDRFLAEGGEHAGKSGT
jgi:hypothetical protein